MIFQSFGRKLLEPLGKRVVPFQNSVFEVLGLVIGFSAVAANAGVITTGDVAVFPGQFTELRVGNTATGSVAVDGGSVLDGAVGLPPVPKPFGFVSIGYRAGSVGTVNVSGAGSALIANTLPPTAPGVEVGISGQGTLNVTDGGSFVGNRLDAGCVAVVSPLVCGPTSTITVDGDHSTITTGSTFNIGSSGSATASITNKGVVNAQTSAIGVAAGSSGLVTVSGEGSALNLVTGTTTAFGRAFLNIGIGGTGRLDVLAGGKALLSAAPIGTTNVGMAIGNTPTGQGTLNIDGPGSELRIAGLLPTMTIGRTGTAVVNITDGGKLITENTASGSIFVGRNAGGTGTVNVTGAGSEWDAGRRLLIGADSVGGVLQPGGTGTVNVAAGGKVTADLPSADAIFVGAQGKLTGDGTVIGNVTNSGTVAPGNSPGIMTILGNLTLNPAGTVEIELAGTNIALAQYDELNAFDDPATASITEGNISIGGNINVSLFGGFNPRGGSFFDVFTAIDITEANPIYNLPALSFGSHWEHTIVATGQGREALRLTVVPEPETYALMLMGLGMLGFVARGRRRQAV